MQIVSYNRQQLQEFIDSDFYKNLKQIPISYHRAVSHINNPDVEDDDELLWAAYDNECLLGYVGVLPNYVNLNNERNKIFWLSCFWVDKTHRKKNIASLLFFPLIKKYREQLLISNFSPYLEKTYQSLGIFKPTYHKTGNKFYCKSCFNAVLPARFHQLRFLKPVFYLVDFLINSVLNLKRLFYKPLPIHSQTVSDDNLDNDLQDFLHQFNKNNNYAERDAKHFNWILKYPWVLQGKIDNESKRYYFSSKAKQFEYEAVKFFRNNKLCASLLLKTRDKKLSVSYVFAEDELYDDITNYILNKISKENLLIINTFDKHIAERIRNHKNRYLVEHKYKYPYIIPKTLDINPEVFQEGDGDNAFT